MSNPELENLLTNAAALRRQRAALKDANADYLSKMKSLNEDMRTTREEIRDLMTMGDLSSYTFEGQTWTLSTKVRTKITESNVRKHLKEGYVDFEEEYCTVETKVTSKRQRAD
jgi:hypothetical protein